MTTNVHLPGRLGDDDRTLANDPRTDPRINAALAPFQLHERAPPPPVAADAPLEAKIEFCNAAEPGYEAMFEVLGSGEAVSGVKRREVSLSGPGGQIKMLIHEPEASTGSLPGILHLHGGGMAILSAEGPVYARWRDSLAVRGTVVVGVEFRNAAGRLGPHAFPAGLDDCSAALDWMHDNRDELGISKLIVSGESGGGNLTLATALKAKKDGRLDRIDGVYAMCPYIYGGWGQGSPELPSLIENDGYFLDGKMMGTMSGVYDPRGDHARNPLCWPYHAQTSDLEGLPPHVISVNELDPLRDEGLAYYRKLLAAGVSASARTVNGTCHAGDLMMPNAVPDLYASTQDDIISFAKRL